MSIVSLRYEVHKIGGQIRAADIEFFRWGTDTFVGVLMKIFFVLLFTIAFLPSARASEATFGSMTAEHHYKQGETLWFISLLYYAKGGEYKRIMEANHLTSTEGLKEGQVLIIPKSTWKVGTPEFEAHYKMVWDKHQEKLHQASGVKTPAATAVSSRSELKEKEKVATHKPKESPVVTADDGLRNSVLVVPIPSSPIFPAGQAPAPTNGEIPGHRNASEGVSH